VGLAISLFAATLNSSEAISIGLGFDPQGSPSPECPGTTLVPPLKFCYLSFSRESSDANVRAARVAEDCQMGYFDVLASGIIRKDERGRTVFYPWGVLGKGRLLPDEAAEKKVFRFVKFCFLVALVLAVGGAFFPWWYSAALLPILLIWYYLQCKALVSTYPVSHSKLRISRP
jgi:hypothetical protein